MAGQAEVKEEHITRRRDPNPIAEIVNGARENLPQEAIIRVFGRILIVSEQIVRSSGGNICVEERLLKYCSYSIFCLSLRRMREADRRDWNDWPSPFSTH